MVAEKKKLTTISNEYNPNDSQVTTNAAPFHFQFQPQVMVVIDITAHKPTVITKKKKKKKKKVTGTRTVMVDSLL